MCREPGSTSCVMPGRRAAMPSKGKQKIRAVFGRARSIETQIAVTCDTGLCTYRKHCQANRASFMAWRHYQALTRYVDRESRPSYRTIPAWSYVPKWNLDGLKYRVHRD